MSEDKLGAEVPDLIIEARWENANDASKFAVRTAKRNTPRIVDEAQRLATKWAAACGLCPMIVVPYLSETSLTLLAEANVSGLDLCGNGLILVPPRLMLWRSGRPNLYPESRAMRFAYRGATSLVPRVFLSRPTFATMKQVVDEISVRGGSVVFSTVWKAIARMQEDLIVAKDDRSIRLIQPERLLEELADSFSAPRSIQEVRLQAKPEDLFRIAKQDESAGPPGVRLGPRLRLVMSGASSQSRYAAGLRSDKPVLYCQSMGELRQQMGAAWRPTERFADLVLIETDDATPFFDSERDGDVRYASRLQTYLELNFSRDKRDREIATQIRDQILAAASAPSTGGR
ncbi:hypothetical protein RAS1_16030 [Phycisphaerae bacterium RAS1]|nr:hypothetical protein RAS1_16030 [Phycisphaerae bacterium RAS1]